MVEPKHDWFRHQLEQPGLLGPLDEKEYTDHEADRLRYYGTVTGRMSSRHPEIQEFQDPLPKRRLHRNHEEVEIMNVNYARLEERVMAHMAHKKNALEQSLENGYPPQVVFDVNADGLARLWQYKALCLTNRWAFENHLLQQVSREWEGTSSFEQAMTMATPAMAECAWEATVGVGHTIDLHDLPPYDRESLPNLPGITKTVTREYAVAQVNKYRDLGDSIKKFRDELFGDAVQEPSRPEPVRSPIGRKRHTDRHEQRHADRPLFGDLLDIRATEARIGTPGGMIFEFRSARNYLIPFSPDTKAVVGMVYEAFRREDHKGKMGGYDMPNGFWDEAVEI